MKKNHGFTLIEVLMATAVVGILIWVAIEWYRQFKGTEVSLAANAELIGTMTDLQASLRDPLQCRDVFRLPGGVLPNWGTLTSLRFAVPELTATNGPSPRTLMKVGTRLNGFTPIKIEVERVHNYAVPTSVMISGVATNAFLFRLRINGAFAVSNPAALPIPMDLPVEELPMILVFLRSTTAGPSLAGDLVQCSTDPTQFPSTLTAPTASTLTLQPATVTVYIPPGVGGSKTGALGPYYDINLAPDGWKACALTERWINCAAGGCKTLAKCRIRKNLVTKNWDLYVEDTSATGLRCSARCVK